MRAGLIATDPMLEADMVSGYIKQEVKWRVAEKLRQYE